MEQRMRGDILIYPPITSHEPKVIINPHHVNEKEKFSVNIYQYLRHLGTCTEGIQADVPCSKVWAIRHIDSMLGPDTGSCPRGSRGSP